MAGAAKMGRRTRPLPACQKRPGKLRRPYHCKVEVVKKNRARRTRKMKVKEDESNQGFDVLTDPVEDL